MVKTVSKAQMLGKHFDLLGNDNTFISTNLTQFSLYVHFDFLATLYYKISLVNFS